MWIWRWYWFDFLRSQGEPVCLPLCFEYLMRNQPKPKLTHSLQSSVIMMAVMTSNNHLVNTNMDLAKRYQCLSRFVPMPDKSKCLEKSVCQVQSLCDIVPILNGALCNITLSLCCQCLPIPDKSKCVSKSVCQSDNTWSTRMELFVTSYCLSVNAYPFPSKAFNVCQFKTKANVLPFNF